MGQMPSRLRELHGRNVLILALPYGPLAEGCITELLPQASLLNSCFLGDDLTLDLRGRVPAICHPWNSPVSVFLRDRLPLTSLWSGRALLVSSKVAAASEDSPSHFSLWFPVFSTLQEAWLSEPPPTRVLFGFCASDIQSHPVTLDLIFAFYSFCYLWPVSWIFNSWESLLLLWTLRFAEVWPPD